MNAGRFGAIGPADAKPLAPSGAIGLPPSGRKAHTHTHTQMKRTLETLACLALSLALVALFSAVALGACGFFD